MPRRFVLLWLILIAISPQAFASPPPIKTHEIVQKADKARGNVEGIEWIAKIESMENEHKQERTIKIQHRDNNNLAEFISPAKVKGRMLLMKNRNMWFIKPGLKKPVPISPRQKLIGTASNGDIASTDYANDYHAELITMAHVNNALCYLFELRAIDKNTTYDRINYWVGTESGLGMKADFYSVSGKLLKTAVFEYNNHIIVNGQNQQFVSKMVIHNAMVKGDWTILTYQQVKIKPIPMSRFNLSSLVR